jgi:RNA polymerase sigma-70 factor (ECF subfamily)
MSDEAGLLAAVEAAGVAWPTVSLPAAALLERVRPLLAASGTLEGLHLDDLYLATAAAGGDRAALSLLDQQFLPTLDRALARIDPSPAFVDECKQLLREKLLVAGAGSGARPPQILEYSGRGPLQRWLRVVATRIALNLRRGPAHEAADQDDLVAVPAGQLDPELEHLQRHYQKEFRAAFEMAMATLSVRERNLLRQQHVDGLDLDQLAALYGVHRVTVFRWVTAARRSLGAATYQLLTRKLGVQTAEVKSLLRLVRSQLDLSIERILGGHPGGSPGS